MTKPITSSISFPNMLDPVRNSVSTVSGNTSIVNRTKLLILTNPTELYNSPDFGVGLSRYLWQYNTANVRAMIEDRIKAQLALHEPCVDADKTEVADGLIFTKPEQTVGSVSDTNKLDITVALKSIYESNNTVDVTIRETDIPTWATADGDRRV